MVRVGEFSDDVCDSLMLNLQTRETSEGSFVYSIYCWKICNYNIFLSWEILYTTKFIFGILYRGAGGEIV
jgi:hypothetical protein